MYFKSIFLEISFVTLWSVFPNPVTYNNVIIIQGSRKMKFIGAQPRTDYSYNYYSHTILINMFKAISWQPMVIFNQ